MRLIWPLLIGLVGCAILISLGVWQLQRLAWKEGVLADIDTRMAAAPAAMPDTLTPETDRFLPVTVSGAYTADELHVLVSHKRAGPGFRIIQGFITDDSRRIMVDRGFVPVDDKDNARPAGQATLIGHLHWPREVDLFTPDPDVENRLWFARDVDSMADQLLTERVLLVVSRTSETDTPVTPLPVETSDIPNNHMQYAITWFALALIWAVMTVTWLIRLRREDHPA